MFPACRSAGEECTIPTFAVVPRDVEGFMDELREFQSAFHDCFARSEPGEHFFDYMVGQCSALERKSIEPMALQGAGGNIRGRQRFISEVAWAEAQMLWVYHHLGADELGDPHGVLRFEESGVVQKGKESVGVARQYCGALGKGEHWPVGVFAAYASRHGYAFLDHRLCMPELWFSAPSAARCAKCQVPKARGCPSKPQLAVAMLEAISREGLVPFRDIGADCLYGNSPDFLDALDACVGGTALVAIPSETRCWLPSPQTEDKSYRSQGEVRSKRVVVAPATAPCSVAALAASLPASRWYRRTVSEGDPGANRVGVCPPTRDAV